MQNKVEALGHHVVSSGTPREFQIFLSWLEVNSRIIGNLIGLYYLKGCSLLDEKLDHMSKRFSYGVNKAAKLY